MKALLLLTGLFLCMTIEAQTYAPYSGNKASGTKVSKPVPVKSEKTKPAVDEKEKTAVVEKTAVKEDEKTKNDIQDFLVKAIEQLHQKDYEKALGFYSQALEISTKESAHIVLTKRATLYAIMKDDEKAVADLTRAIEIKDTPKEQLPIIYVMRARIYANNKNKDLACKDVTKAKALGASYELTRDFECK